MTRHIRSSDPRYSDAEMLRSIPVRLVLIGSYRSVPCLAPYCELYCERMASLKIDSRSRYWYGFIPPAQRAADPGFDQASNQGGHPREGASLRRHPDFQVGVDDFAMVPGVFSAPPVLVKDSLRGVLTLPASWISLSIALSPSVFLLGQVITSRPGRNDPRFPSTKR